MADDLEPCPFCGSTDLRANVGLMAFADVEITCEGCSASGGNHDLDSGGDDLERNRANAIAAWNKREAVARIRSLEAELAEARDVFRHYGDLHAAKPDPVKAQRNYDLAAKIEAALKAPR